MTVPFHLFYLKFQCFGLKNRFKNQILLQIILICWSQFNSHIWPSLKSFTVPREAPEMIKLHLSVLGLECHTAFLPYFFFCVCDWLLTKLLIPTRSRQNDVWGTNVLQLLIWQILCWNSTERVCNILMEQKVATFFKHDLCIEIESERVKSENSRFQNLSTSL